MKSKSKLVSRRDILRWGGAGALLTLGVCATGTVESSALVLEKHELRLPKWDADGFRVAVISDIHVNDPIAGARAQVAVQHALDEKPDLIVLPGDFVNFGWSYTIDGMIKSLEGLHNAKCPVLATLGNHDYDSTNPDGIVEALTKRTPVKMLRNESVEIQGVSVVGIDDALFNMQKPEIVGDLQNKSILVLFHEPDYVVDMPRNASLQISGHSHGGQLCLPFGYPLLHRPGARRYITGGFYPDANVPLYLTRGVGTVGLSIRTFCPPEVTILTLRSAA